MGLDIRLPIGLMFTLVGFLLVIAGKVYDNDAMRAKSLHININMYWGLFLIVFGILMLALAWMGKKNDGQQPKN